MKKTENVTLPKDIFEMFWANTEHIWDMQNPIEQVEALTDTALGFLNFCSVVSGGKSVFGSDCFFNTSNFALANSVISEAQKALQKNSINSENAKKRTTTKATNKTTSKTTKK